MTTALTQIKTKLETTKHEFVGKEATFKQEEHKNTKRRKEVMSGREPI